MPLYIHNTLTRRKEEFKPINPERVTMYVCGPTVYDYTHIGNARPAVVFDVLYRLLRQHYAEVVYARNITDIDDKIIDAAEKENVGIDEITRRYTAAYHEDMRALGVLAPTVEPFATEHIAAMLDMVERLLLRGHAYVSQGNVLFRVASMPEYGRLSGRNLDEARAGARVEAADYKQDPNDFALWKPSSPRQPGWASPWGRGRPGWHLECSAMIKAHLGEVIDIHGGGRDLIFPHHENEIAQGRCAHGGDGYVNYWMHNGYLTMDGEKMAKSVGNFLTIRDTLKRAPGEALRYALLGAQYRQPLDWSERTITQAKAGLDRLYNALRIAGDVDAPPPTDAPQPVMAALYDDLNTPVALARLHEFAGALNKAGDAAAKAEAKARLLAGGQVMGLLGQDPEDWFRRPAEGLTDMDIEALITARADARAAKDFARADAIRDQLQAQGIALEDGPAGSKWRRV